MRLAHSTLIRRSAVGCAQASGSLARAPSSSAARAASGVSARTGDVARMRPQKRTPIVLRMTEGITLDPGPGDLDDVHLAEGIATVAADRAVFLGSQHAPRHAREL